MRESYEAQTYTFDASNALVTSKINEEGKVQAAMLLIALLLKYIAV